MESDRLREPRSLALDACRGIAVIMVIISHLGLFRIFPSLPETVRLTQEMGIFGVDLFYVLSGFFITQAVLRPTHWDPRRFAIARITRIYPAYLVSIAAYLVPILYVQGIGTELVAKTMLHVTMLHNFLPRTNSYLNTAYWTLGVEFPYYMAMLAMAVFLREQKLFVQIVIGMIAISILWRTAVFITIAGEYRFWVLTQLPGALDAFALGGIVARLHLSERLNARLSRWRWGLICVGVLCALACLGYFALHSFEFWTVPLGAMLWRTALALSFALIVAGCANTRNSRALALTGLPWVGKISYSLYLFHGLAIGAIIALSARWNWRLELGATLLLMAVISWLSWRFVETRFHRSLTTMTPVGPAESRPTGQSAVKPSIPAA